MRYFIGFASAIALLFLVGAIVVFTGAYNFAATDPHLGVVRTTINTALQSSVSSRADELTAPASFSQAELREGAQEFMEYCVHCHGAPGIKPHEWATGMRPDPPPLSRAAKEWSIEEIFWIAKHGIKMSGMPAFGDTESDEKLWKIAAFVNRLPRISPAEYARLQAEFSKGEGGQSGHSHAPGQGH